MKMKIAVIVVLLAHAAAIGTLLSTQGCQTSSPSVEPPPPPPLPPKSEALPDPVSSTGLLRPPTPVKMDPERLAKAEPVTVEVQKGESLSQIAARHGLTTRELADLNAIADPNRVRIGQKIIIPGYAANLQLPKVSSKPRAKPVSATGSSAPVAAGAAYTVKKGDTLSHIAQAHKVKVADLRTLNNLSGDSIREGQKLTLPASAVSVPAVPAAAPVPAPVVEPVSAEPATVTLPDLPVAPTPEPAPTMEAPAVPVAPAPLLPPAEAPVPDSSTFPYPSGAGDTLASIAKNFVVDPEVLTRLNPTVDFANLKPGTRILIPLAP